MDGLGLTPAGPPGRRVSRIGLTGGIGSGKSTAARLLVKAGAALVDTDAIARALTSPGGAAMPALVAAFGADVATAGGALDRDRMRALAFADAESKARLEAVLHPLIGAEAARQAQRHAVDGAARAIVFDVPLLAESAHWRQRVDRVLVVDCSAETQIARVCVRPGWTAEAAARVVAQQAPRTARRGIADAVIFNDGLSLDALARQVRRLWTLWNNPGG